MARDNAPVPHTCPMINEIISAIESIEWGEDSYWTKEELVEKMEKIRSANSKLRDWGNEKHTECDTLEDEKSDLEKDIRNLEDEKSNLERDITELNQRIEELEYNLINNN